MEEVSQWHVEALQEAVTPGELTAITSTMVASSDQEDFLAWPHSKNGEFTVKSAYHLELQKRKGGVGTSSMSDNKWFWKKIWLANVPPKVKNFFWRASRGGLPTMDVLAKRGLDVDKMCPRCGEVPETIIHILVLCRESNIIWKMSPLRVDITEWNHSFMEWGVSLARKATVDRYWECVMMLAWQIWNLCNSWVFENRRLDPSLMCERAMRLLQEYEDACDREVFDVSFPIVTSNQCSWQPPALGTVKLNTDVAVLKDGKVGLEAVVRDHEGDVLMIVGRRGNDSNPVAQAEAEALFFGLQRAFDCGYGRIMVEVDCLGLVELINAKKKELSVTQVMANDIMHFSSNFDLCSFNLCRRNCNQVAHAMANFALSFEKELVWLEECPQNILHFVVVDRSAS